MNRNVFSPMPKETRAAGSAGAHVDLRTLTALEFRARGFSLLPRQPVGSLLAGGHGSRLRGRGLNFEELRRYLPGDDLRAMDWHATARRGDPYVRVYGEERDRPCLLVVDQRASMFFGSRRAMKSVAAAEFAALAAWRVLRANDRVGAIVFDDREIVEFAPHRSRGRVLEILRAVVAKNGALRGDRPASDPSIFGRVMERAARTARHDHLVVLVTDGFGADAESVRLGDRIAAHNDLLAAFVFDPLEAALADGGRLVASDGQGRLEFDTTDADLRSNFAGEFEDRLARVNAISRRRRMPVLKISAAEDVLPQVRRQLGQRPPRRGG